MQLQNKNYEELFVNRFIERERHAYEIFSKDARDTFELIDYFNRNSRYKDSLYKGHSWVFSTTGTAYEEAVENADIPKSNIVVMKPVLDWMASAYIRWQWDTQRPFSELSELCNAQTLSSLYNKFNDTSIEEVSKELTEMFLNQELEIDR